MGEQTGGESYSWTELVVVTVILGILALIVVPQFSEGVDDPRRAALKGRLQTLRAQFELYRVEHNEVYPWDDGAGNLASSKEIVRRLSSGTDAQGNPGGDLGPYLQSVPANPYLDRATVTFGGKSGDNVDWVVDVRTGAITGGCPEE